MKRFVLAAFFSIAALPAGAQQQSPSGALQLLGRCTQETATLIDQLNAGQAEITTLKAELAKAKTPPVPQTTPPTDKSP